MTLLLLSISVILVISTLVILSKTTAPNKYKYSSSRFTREVFRDWD